MSAPDLAPVANIIPEQSLFRIGDVSRLTGIKAFVLRYWETEFPMLQPVKSPSGHRLYRREDVQTVLEIRRLLYDEGFTIAGARRHLRDRGLEDAGSQAATNTEAPHPADPSAAATGNAESNETRAPAPQPARAAEVNPLPGINRKTLLDLRDSLRAFLTLLENE
ncbi:MAG TPA: MerR family transcriptional regulator [Candidatus Acidoferrales bacterium]|nr:MerR family transcriptional regulator [Candidatus Acidoferrales bacterium]